MYPWYLQGKGYRKWVVKKEILEARYLPPAKEDMAEAGISTPMFMQDHSSILSQFGLSGRLAGGLERDSELLDALTKSMPWRVAAGGLEHKVLIASGA